MEKDYKSEIENIISTMKCPWGCGCYKRGLKPVCKTIDIGEDYVKIEETGGNGCGHKISLGRESYCKCPLHVYLAKNILLPSYKNLGVNKKRIRSRF